ncbi:hypothetical protein [Cellulomonas persica]|uniref:Uncharacterized protein n=1 Tax=Cellulomonas persica TaxID=76861 RepID=A0A510UVX6_9CELL|nr:hypothetical protein [Cellulomonas persica]GEK18844.1 hypothetical protein CPE01_25770 [Cellulomonas persica]
MLVAAALVPDTALLVPGVSGRQDAAGGLREAATSAVRRAVAGAERVVVVAPGRPARSPSRSRADVLTDGETGQSTAVHVVAVVGLVRATLAAAGVPDTLLAPVPPVALAPPPLDTGTAIMTPAAGVSTAVALRLLAAAGGAATHAVETTGTDGTALRALGARLVAGTGRDALVVVGSASGRHGPDAPLADDPDALAYDDALVADLRTADPAARERLAALDPHRAAGLAVTGWGPWQVLVGAAGPRTVVRADVAGDVLLGAQHVVGTWHVEAPA